MFGGAVLPSIRAGHGMPCPYGRGSEIPLCAAFAVPQGGRDAGAVRWRASGVKTPEISGTGGTAEAVL
jgi:hypothetical protein